MSKLDDLRKVTTLPELATLLGMKGSALSYILYWTPIDNRYQEFLIPKRSGGQRSILAPNPKLKLVQRRLAELLADIQYELETKRVRKFCIVSHGFKKRHSISSNAVKHKNRRFVLNIDIEDFFPAFNFGRVRGFFIKDRNFELSSKIATIIAQIACYQNKLPQGSPCSPIISEILTHIMDVKLGKLASANHCTYTRYVDDMTFSTNERVFPSAIGSLKGDPEQFWQPGNDLIRIVSRSGFSLNRNKTRMQLKNSRQDVTGLIVNRKINVKNEYIKLCRSMCHHLFENGFSFRTDNRRFETVSEHALIGRMSFIYSIRRLNNLDFKKDQRGFYTLYGQLLNYNSFHSIQAPKIVCEGKTDVIYLKAAIRATTGKFPALLNPTVSPDIAISFLNYTKRSAFFQQLAGGTDEMKKLLGDYRSRISSFKQPALHPVILIVDNDAGSVDLFKVLGKVIGKTIGGSDPFYYVYANLYVVPIPKYGSSAAIEDLFAPKLLEVTIDGRKFDRSGKQKDGSKWYSKNEFATKIVRPNRSVIDFSGFEKLLEAIVAVFSDYQKRSTSKAKVSLAA